MKAELEQLCETLKLQGMGNVLADVLLEAEQDQQPFIHHLKRLLEAEYNNRQERSLTNRIKHAKLPWDWSLRTFPFDEQPGVRKSQIMNLSSLDFIKRVENIIFVGNPGTGKSGLAMGLLREALINGYRGRFYNAQDLLDELYTSLADRSTGKLMNMLVRYDILVIDELGYLTLNTEQANAFFKLMDMRYGRKATIITTNLSFEQWYELFKNKPLVDALLDRLQHRCITIQIKGPSLRQSVNDDQTQAKTSAKKSKNNTNTNNQA